MASDGDNHGEMPKTSTEGDRSLRKAGKDRFQARNWKELTAKELKRLAPQALSRFMAYEPPSKEMLSAKEACVKRVREFRKCREREVCVQSDSVAMSRHRELIGELKAAEARSRLRDARIRYESNQVREVNHLITCQPTTCEAVRFEAFVPPEPEPVPPRDPMKKAEVYTLVQQNRNTVMRYSLTILVSSIHFMLCWGWVVCQMANRQTDAEWTKQYRYRQHLGCYINQLFFPYFVIR